MTWDVGQAYIASLLVTDADSNPVTPGTATLTITQPDQSVLTPPIALPPAQPGMLSYTFVSTMPGLHKFAWATTNPSVPKTDYENFRNFVSAISLADAKARLGLKNTTRDEQVRLLMSAATREVEKVTGVLVPRLYTDDWIPGTYRDVLRVPHGPIFSETSVTALKSAYPQGPSWDISELLVNTSPGTIRHTGLIPFWYGPWKVTYTAGLAEIPEPVVEGIKEVLFDLWAQMRGLSADIAEAAATDALAGMPFYRLPPRALAAIKGYEMPGFG